SARNRVSLLPAVLLKLTVRLARPPLTSLMARHDPLSIEPEPVLLSRRRLGLGPLLLTVGRLGRAPLAPGERTRPAPPQCAAAQAAHPRADRHTAHPRPH